MCLSHDGSGPIVRYEGAHQLGSNTVTEKQGGPHSNKKFYIFLYVFFQNKRRAGAINEVARIFVSSEETCNEERRPRIQKRARAGEKALSPVKHPPLALLLSPVISIPFVRKFPGPWKRWMSFSWCWFLTWSGPWPFILAAHKPPSQPHYRLHWAWWIHLLESQKQSKGSVIGKGASYKKIQEPLGGFQLYSRP